MPHLMILLFLTLLANLNAAVDPYSWRVDQINAAGTGLDTPRYLPPYAGGDNFIPYFIGSTNLPGRLKLGNLTITGGDTLNAPGSPAFSAASPSRSFNTPWQATANLLNGKYSIKIATGLSIAGGAEGEVYADQADDSGFTTNVVNLGVISNGQTGTLVVGLAVNQTITLELSTGFVPSGKYLRLRTNNVSGTPTYALTKVRESTY